MKKGFKLSPLAIVFAIVFFDLLGFGILIPVIPQLLANPISPDYLLPAGWTIKDGFIALGFLTALYSFGQFIANPILGELSDKYGRKRILAICLAGTALSYVVFAYAIITKNVPLLFISRFVDGITGGNISVAQAVIADITKPSERAKSFGLIGAAFGLGFILGPYIGGKLADPSIVSWFSASTPFWFAAILGALNFLAVVLWLPETLKDRKEKIKLHLLQSFHNIGQVFKLPPLRTIFITSFLMQGGFTFFTTFASVFLITRFSFTQGNIGDYFSYLGLWIAFSQAVVTRKVSALFREDQILKVTIIGMAICIAAFFLPTVRWQLFLIAPFFAMFNGLTMANMTSLVSKQATAENQGEVLGISSSVQALAQTIPAAISGYIAASLASDTPLIVGSLTVLLAGLAFNFFYRNSNQEFSDRGGKDAAPALSH